MINLTNLIPWPFKIIILLSGIKYVILGGVLVLLDGIFHFTTPLQKLIQQSPDWIIARGLFKTNGLNETIHKIMGITLIISSLYYLLIGQYDNNKFNKLYISIIQPITLIIITFAILFKNIVLNTSGNVAIL